jgi:hypothetical protein
MRKQAMIALLHLGESAVCGILDSVDPKSFDSIRLAALVLGMMVKGIEGNQDGVYLDFKPNPQIVVLLAAVVRDRGQSTMRRAAACLSLGCMGELATSAKSALEDVAKHDPDQNMQDMAAVTLGKILGDAQDKKIERDLDKTAPAPASQAQQIPAIEEIDGLPPLTGPDKHNHNKRDEKPENKVTDAYRMAKAEYDAAHLLRIARRLAKDAKANPQYGEQLFQRVDDRYRQIIRDFPGTQAAVDAQNLLNGLEPPNRPMPPDPDKPRMP